MNVCAPLQTLGDRETSSRVALGMHKIVFHAIAAKIVVLKLLRQAQNRATQIQPKPGFLEILFLA